jgi:bifunctional non-homologous end joining protein LigD
VIEDEDGLAYIANMGAIPLHVWSSRTGSLQHPDWCILDLDPKGAPFAHVVQVARTLHKLCESIGLPHFVKTSGSTGIHVLIPLGARYTHAQSRNLAELLAHWAVKTLPEVATVQRHIEARDGKVYVDYLQNGHGRLLVAPFSVRPVPGAAVSMPLRWGQVSAKLDMHRYNMLSVPKLMAKMKFDPLLDMFNAAADLTVSMARLQDAL